MTAGRSAILVLRGGALGDFIVTLPTLLALRERFPSSRIVFVGNHVAAELARTRGLVDEVFSQHDRQWGALGLPQPLPAELREWLSGFDLIVSWWPDEDGAIASHFPVRAGQTFLGANGPPAAQVHLAGATGGGAPAMPAAAYLARALEPLGIKLRASYVLLGETSIHWPDRVPAEAGIQTAGTDACRQEAQASPPATARGLAVHPGSGSPKKNWPRDRWIELLRQLSTPVRLIAGEVEAATWNASALRESAVGPKLADGSLRVLASAPLEEMMVELRSCSSYLGHDTGVSHLAAACGVPSLLLFGPTNAAIWAPPAPHVRVLQPAAGLATLDVPTVLSALQTPIQNVTY